MKEGATSPASSGPAGALFEAQVAANYLLSMLVGGAPRGLPGIQFEDVSLQRGDEGHPLDDIVVRGCDPSGAAAVIEVQVKRDITFAPSDPVFKSVVGQIASASAQNGFWDRTHELAIATAHASRKITGSYQDVLTWARELGSAKEFMARIGRRGSANPDMRSFVSTFRTNLQAAGVDDEEGMVWRLLRRMQIHVYDFTSQGSASSELARERAAQALHRSEASGAGALWAALISNAIEIAAVGGSRTRAQLTAAIGRDFRLAGDRRFTQARAVLAEASAQALNGIKSHVLATSLGRHERLDAIRTAALGCRYVEIRGDAGVGKSGLLKHFARQVGSEGQVFVATPLRTTPRGWTALRSVLGFDGTAVEFLQDLAADGGGWLFIDNLDFYQEYERATIYDLLVAAADVPSITVVATARTRFGIEEPSWLPPAALDRLGRAVPVVVGELSSSEVAELQAHEPKLRTLLSEGHPARSVIRNLFRLARLADQSTVDPVPRSEVDMLNVWWRTADGRADRNLRDRRRLLYDLAMLGLKGQQTFNVRTYDSVSVDALVESETLLDHGNDCVSFRHDVLLEWAIASVVAAEMELIGEFDLEQYGQGAHMRAVELAARIILEDGSDISSWRGLLDAVSIPRAHGSWRRAVLLSVVHSEIAGELLGRLEPELLAHDAELLRDIIPLVIAVDVKPFREFVGEARSDAPLPSDSLSFPNHSSWRHLVTWVHDLGERLPSVAIPSVVQLYWGWSVVGLMMRDPVTPLIVVQMGGWLDAIECASDTGKYAERRLVLGGVLSNSELTTLEDDLRQTLSVLAFRAPEWARSYVSSVKARRRMHKIGSKILKFRGTLARVAAEELADLTAELLLHSEPRSRGDEALHYLDKEFVPASPAQGPFFELLTHSPEHGLALVRKLVDGAIAFHADGELPSADDAIVIDMEGATRRFVWRRTYAWSRTSHYYSITSGLMAIEAWGHARIDNGEPPDKVISEIIGQGDVPAAYLLLAVDMLISHWPLTREVAVPFLATPELLTLDLGRPVQEGMHVPDIFGLKLLQRSEPAGPKLSDLKVRSSHSNSLDAVLLRLGVGKWGGLREQVVARLKEATARLGPYEEADTLGSPRLMAVHALNLLEPSNYRGVEVQQDDGSIVTAHEFVMPEAEARHFDALQQKSRKNFDDFNATLVVGRLIDRQETADFETVELITSWAHEALSRDRPIDEDVAEAVDQAIVGAALVAMRDGTPEHRELHQAWAEEIFAATASAEPDPVRQLRDGLKFNPPAMAFAGRVSALELGPTPDKLRTLLEMAVSDAAVAHGAAASKSVMRKIDPRLPRAVLRVALSATYRFWHDLEVDELVRETAETQLRQCQLDAVDRELEWLMNGGAEPEWPTFTNEHNRKQPRQRGIRIGGAPRQVAFPTRLTSVQYIDHQAAALWLRSLFHKLDGEDRVAMREFCQSYSEWTYATNGRGLPADQEPGETPSEWNDAYFNLLAQTLPGATHHEAILATRPITELPEQQFYDVVTDFLRSIDIVYFDDRSLDASVAYDVRSLLADHLVDTWGWKRLRGKSGGIEIHLGPAVAAMFFCDHLFGAPPASYLRPVAIEPAAAFWPILEKLAASAPSPFVALAALSTLEVLPRAEQFGLVRVLGLASLREYPSDRSFWIDHGVGRRLCLWLEKMLAAEESLFSPNAPSRMELDHLLAKLVALGVSEARRIEISLPRA